MISIVVCTYNGSSRIKSCLFSLLAQENPPDYEILVVDNASTDGTGELVQTYLSSSFSLGSWKLIREDRPGLLHARLAGLKNASFDWVLFCDDDNLLFPDFLSQCREILSENTQIGVLGSRGIPEFLGPRPDWFDHYFSSYAVGEQEVNDSNGKSLVHVYGASSVYRRKPLLELFENGFVPVLSDRKADQLMSGGDVEWCWLMQLLGYKIAYSAKLQFFHQLPATRLTWDYYLRLKRGISGGAGLLNVYTFFASSSFRAMIGFIIYYCGKTAKALLLYGKYWLRWRGNPVRPQDQLSFAILEAQMKAYLKQGKLAYAHFNQLKRYFGN